MEKVNHKIIPATYDKVFKALMQSKEARRYLEEVIGSITGIPMELIRDKIVFENTEIPVESVKEKTKITDLVVSIGQNVINLEMNKYYYKGLIEKNEAYISKLRSLRVGERYIEDTKYIQINFDNFGKYKETISKFVMMEEKTHEKETENYEKYHINLKRIKEKYYNEEKINKKEKLLLMLTIDNEKDLEKVSEGDDIMCEAKKKILSLSKEDAMILCYDEEEYKEYVRQRRTEDEVREGFQKGIQKGIEEGLQKGKKENSINIAKSLLKEDMKVDKIAKITGLTVEEIKKL